MKNAVIDEFRPFLIKTAINIPVITPSYPSTIKKNKFNNYLLEEKKVSGINIESAIILKISGTSPAIQKYNREENIHEESETKWNYNKFTIFVSISSPNFIAAYIIGRIAVVANSVVMKLRETSDP